MKKIIDEKGRLFGKISIIDIFVIILVFALCAAIYMRFFTKEETAVTTADEFTYQIKVNKIRDNTANSIRVGDKLFSENAAGLIGTITAVDVTDAEVEVKMDDGTFTVASTPDRKDVVITVNTEGLISGGRCFAGKNYEIAVNDTVIVCTKYCSFQGTVWDIAK